MVGQNVEEPQGSVKTKMQVKCVSTSGDGTRRFKEKFQD